MAPSPGLHSGVESHYWVCDNYLNFGIKFATLQVRSERVAWLVRGECVPLLLWSICC